MRFWKNEIDEEKYKMIKYNKNMIKYNKNMIKYNKNMIK